MKKETLFAITVGCFIGVLLLYLKAGFNDWRFYVLTIGISLIMGALYSNCKD